MNREIKFRAWKKENSPEMIHIVSSIDWVNKEISFRYRLNSWTFRDDKESMDNIILMQYTGLKDKNGVEIYGNDVIEKEGHPSYYVSFESGSYVVISTNSIQALNWEHRNLSDMLDLGFTYIGNIFENPDLLEETK